MVGGKADDKNRLLLGRIGAAHGIKGEVRITPFTGEPLAIAVERAERYWIGHAPGRERDPVIATFKTWLRAEASSG